MQIYGAGIAGLLAGCMFPTAKIFEAGPEHQAQHKAVLRFRSKAVGDAVGIEFRPVRVHKGIWMDTRFVNPSIDAANLYSTKVIGRLADRSIWNVDPADRYIAPENFIEQLADRCHGRVEWNHALTAEEVMENSSVAISTLPMSVMAKFVDIYSAHELDLPEFKHEEITVRRWRIPNADVFQTVYFPELFTTLYRASITGDLLIAEYVGEADDFYFWDAFGLHHSQAEPIEKVSQRFGKIAKIDDNWRKGFIHRLTTNHNIFSLGRFGTWRNLLLDDVIKDISVIKKLINTSTYDRLRHNAK